MCSTRIIRAGAAAALAVGVVACGNTTAGSGTPTHAATTRFLQIVRETDLGDLDVVSVPDHTLLTLGQATCTEMWLAVSYPDVVETLVRSKAKPTVHQASVFVDAAARNLCPAYRDQLPVGAP